MAQPSANEWFYHSSSTGLRNSTGITLPQLKQLISSHSLESNTLIWHPTVVPEWTKLKALTKPTQKLLNINVTHNPSKKHHKKKSNKSKHSKPNTPNMKSTNSRGHRKSSSASITKSQSVHHRRHDSDDQPQQQKSRKSHSNKGRKARPSPSISSQHSSHHPPKPKPVHRRSSSHSHSTSHLRSNSTSRSESHSYSYNLRHSASSNSSSSHSGTPTISASAASSNSPPKKSIATIHKRDPTAQKSKSRSNSMGYIFQNILSNNTPSQPHKIKQILNESPQKLSTPDYDSERNPRRISMCSDITIPPPFPEQQVSDQDDHYIETMGKDVFITSTGHSRTRKNSDSLDMGHISEFTRNFSTSTNTNIESKDNASYDEKEDDDHQPHHLRIKPTPSNSKSKSKSKSARQYIHDKKARNKSIHHRSKTLSQSKSSKSSKTGIKGKHVMNRKKMKGRQSASAHSKSSKSRKKRSNKHRKKKKTTKRGPEPIPNITLKDFISSYNDMRRDKFRDKLTISRNLFAERNQQSLEIEKQYFKAEYSYKQCQLQSRQRYINKQIDLYTKGIKIINNNLKSSKNLQQFIATNLESSSSSSSKSSRHKKKNLRRAHRKRNGKLKKEMMEQRKFESMLNEAGSDMIDEVSKPHKNMLVATKQLKQQITDISKCLESQSTSMEIQFSQITRSRKSVLEVPWHSLSSEGDINLHFNELMNPLYKMYKEVTQQEKEWFNDRTSIREQCMIHRLFWKKYSQWQTLQNKLDEMKKREYESNEYTASLEKEMNDIIENNHFDKFQMQINQKQAMIKAKEDALMEKQETINTLQTIFDAYKMNVSFMTKQVDKMEHDNDRSQRKIAKMNKKGYQALIHSDKIDPEMQQYLMNHKKIVKSQESTLDHLWRAMNEKRQILRSLQADTKQMKYETNYDSAEDDEMTLDGSFSLDIDDDFDESLEDEQNTETPRSPSRQKTKDKPTESMSFEEQIAKLQNDIKQEKDQIQELNKKIAKQNREIEKKDKEIDSKSKRKQNIDQSLQFVQSTHDKLYEQYKDLNGKIEKLNDERRVKFKEMFDGVLSSSQSKISKLSQFKSKQRICITPSPQPQQQSNNANSANLVHQNMDVDDAKSNNRDLLNIRGENGENEEKSLELEFPGQHEPGTTPPDMSDQHRNNPKTHENDEEEAPFQLMTRKGSIAVGHMDNLCMKNNRIVTKIFDELKHVYDIDEDLDFENTMLELRSVMDSIRNDRARLDETFANEKQLLEGKEKEIEDEYRKQKLILKKERDKQKREIQKERKRAELKKRETERKQLLRRVGSPELTNIHSRDSRNLNDDQEEEDDVDGLVDSMSSMSELDSSCGLNSSDFDSENEITKKQKKKKVKPTKSRGKKFKPSRRRKNQSKINKAYD